MTYRRHPMNKRINAPRPRRRRQVSHATAIRDASRALVACANAVGIALAAVSDAAVSAARKVRDFNPPRSEYVLAN